MALLCSPMEISPLFRSVKPNSPLRRINPNPNSRVSVSSCLCEEKVKERKSGRVIRVSDPIRSPRSELGLGLGPILHDNCDSSSISTLEKKKSDDKRDYYVNIGYAIRTLREEFPLIFYKEPNFDIYREDMVFKDPLNTFHGLPNYKLLCSLLRLFRQMLFKSLTIEILSIWQPSDLSIMIRWTAHGVPRVPWGAKGRFDATSEYRLDREGRVCEHRVDVVERRREGFRVLEMGDLVRMVMCGNGNEARPTFYK